ncbi:SPX and EXS domain-containing protein 1 [Linum grandiflorum]
MFGGQVIPPGNSPHLRKSGSRPVVFDLDGEHGNGTEEGFSPSSESDNLKSLPIQLSAAAAMMPSPVLLWRFKVFFSSFLSCITVWSLLLLVDRVFLFFLWGFVCCKIGWGSVMRMSANLRDLFLYEVFLYYNPLLLVAFAVWLWGANLWVFSQSTVSYAKIFDLDQSHLTHREIWKIAMWMTIVVPSSMTAYLYLYSHGEVSLAASQPVYLPYVTTHTKTSHLFLQVLLYCAVTMILIFPFDIFYLSSRYFLLRTIWRILFPLQACNAITFADFFLADILTSMSKVATIAWFEADSICGSHSVAIPLVLVLPYLFRLFQCLRQYKDTKEKTSLFNALKYSTAVPVIFLSALKYHVFPDRWTNFYRPLWLLSSFLNCLYSFYWDVTRDWDLSGFTRIFKFNRPSLCSYLLHGRKWVYFWVIGSNLILRCTWTYKLSAHLRHNYLTVFAITALEIFRRFQWVFFRVENEWNKMSSKSPASQQQVSMSEMSMEDEKLKLLSSSDHNV